MKKLNIKTLLLSSIIAGIALTGCASDSYDTFALNGQPKIDTPTVFPTPVDSPSPVQAMQMTTKIISLNVILYSSQYDKNGKSINIDLNGNADSSETNRVLVVNANFLKNTDSAVITLISYNDNNAKTKSQKSADKKLQEKRLQSIKSRLVAMGVEGNQVKFLKQQTSTSEFAHIELKYITTDKDLAPVGYSDSASPLTKNGWPTITKTIKTVATPVTIDLDQTN